MKANIMKNAKPAIPRLERPNVIKAIRCLAQDKYCKDCTHFIEDTSFTAGSPEAKRYGYCKLFSVRDIVSGEDRYVHARTIRMKDIPGVPTCGIHAAFYQVKKENVK